MTVCCAAVIVTPMLKELTQPARDFSAASFDETSADTNNRLLVERVRLSGEQVNVSILMAIAVLTGFTVILREHLEVMFFAFSPLLLCPYLLLFFATRRLLKRPIAETNLKRWVVALAWIAALAGLFWGGAVGWLMLQAKLEINLLLAPLIVVIAAIGTFSFGVIPTAYFTYVSGLLIPVGLAYSIKTSGFDIVQVVVIIMLSTLALLLVARLRQWFDNWFNLAIENSELVYQLSEKEEFSQQTIADLKTEFEERRQADNLLLIDQFSEKSKEFECIQLHFSDEIESYQQAKVDAENRESILSDLLALAPGMAYRATNDANKSIEFISDGCEQLLGLTKSQIEQRGLLKLGDLLVPNRRRSTDASVVTNEDDEGYQREFYLLMPCGGERRVVEKGVKVYDKRGKLTALHGFVMDVTEHHRLVEEINQLASSDDLTGLPGRVQFESTVASMIEGIDSNQQVHSLLCIDIDHFREINDEFGAAVADQVLCDFAIWLRQHFKQFKSLARIGGDQFGVVLPESDLEQAALVAGELCHSLQFQEFFADRESIKLTISIGVASTASGLVIFQDLLSAAYRATNIAKENGRNRVNMYHRGDSVLLEASREMH